MTKKSRVDNVSVRWGVREGIKSWEVYVYILLLDNYEDMERFGVLII